MAESAVSKTLLSQNKLNKKVFYFFDVFAFLSKLCFVSDIGTKMIFPSWIAPVIAPSVLIWTYPKAEI